LTLLALFVAGMAAWVAWERRIVVGWRRSRRLLDAGSGSSADSAASDVDGAVAGEDA
jgi:hypothetical protein